MPKLPGLDPTWLNASRVNAASGHFGQPQPAHQANQTGGATEGDSGFKRPAQATGVAETHPPTPDPAPAGSPLRFPHLAAGPGSGKAAGRRKQEIPRPPACLPARRRESGWVKP